MHPHLGLEWGQEPDLLDTERKTRRGDLAGRPEQSGGRLQCAVEQTRMQDRLRPVVLAVGREAQVRQ